MELTLGRAAYFLWRGAIDTIVPPRCLGCGEEATVPSSLCVTCWNGLHHIDEPACNSLGLPLAYDQGEDAVSPAALASPPSWDRARAAVVYDEASRRLVHLLKFQDTQEAGLLMARMMARAGRRLLAEADALVPIPLHPFRLWTRRFNQASYLAERLSRASGREFLPLALKRRRMTRPQVGLDASARRRNVDGAFSVDPSWQPAIDGRRILLIDDVRTTGATATACVKALRGAGASQVDLLTFALVINPIQPDI
mgnify:CR=1 FL=1|jgi:ComF family protein